MITTQIKTLIKIPSLQLSVWLVALSCLSLAYTQVSYAQQTAQTNAYSNTATSSSSSTTDAEQEQFTLNMRDADIQGFIQWVANRTGKNIVIHRN